MIPSLIGCHSAATAAMYRGENHNMDSLHVDFLKPTPIDVTRVIRSRVKPIKGRKGLLETTVPAGDVATARGEVVAERMPEDFGL